MKRCIRTILFFLLLGAAVNVAVAWIAAVTAEPKSEGIRFTRPHDVMPDQPSDRGGFVGIWRCAGGTRIWVFMTETPAPSEIDVDAIKEFVRRSWSHDPRHLRPSEASVLPAWSRAGVRIDRDGIPRRGSLVEDAWGWPMKAMYARFEADRLGLIRPEAVSWGVHCGSYGPAIEEWLIPRVVPVGPIWPGFAVNTVIYALPLWLLALCPVALRRRIRRKRGRCIKCGYDLRGDLAAGCPECGWNRGEAET